MTDSAGAGDPLVGRNVGPYQIQLLLGKGGMGRVYRALDPALGRVVAIKVLRDDLAGNSDYVRRFAREVRLAARITHPGVAQVYAAGSDGGVHYLAMQYVKGRPLRELLRATPKVEVRRALELVWRVASALGAAHALGIVHRDVKPDNIMIDEGGRPIILDFGIARGIEGDSLTSAGSAVGTPRYMAPEQVVGERAIDGRADFFALGSTLYEMLAGTPPFGGADWTSTLREILEKPTPDIRAVRPDVPAGVAALLDRMLAKDPAHRHRDAAELQAALRALLAGEEVPAFDTIEGTPLPSTPSRGSGPTAASGGAARRATVHATPRKIDSIVDMFWAATDWLVGAKGKPESAETAADRRRRAALAERGDDPAAMDYAAPDASETETSLAGDDRTARMKPRDGLRERLMRPVERIRAAARARRERRAARPKGLVCPVCSHEQNPPALYCEKCREPFVHMGKATIAGTLSLGATCFFAAEYYREGMEWPWPLYVFYGVVFLLFNAMAMKGSRKFALTATVWGAVFLGGGFAVLLFGPEEARDFVLTATHQFGSLLAEQPPALFAFAGGIVVAFAILVGAMSFKYTFAHAYRILFVLAAAAAFALERVWPKLMEFAPFARATDFIEPELATRFLELAWVNLLRALVAELVVYSMVKARKPAAENFARRRLRPKPKPAAGPKSPIDPLVESLYGLSLTLANGFTAFSLQTSHSLLLLGRTLAAFGARLGDFVWMLTRDLVAPVASLVGASAALYHLSVATGDYIRDRRLAELTVVVAALAGLSLAQLVFLAARTRIPIPRLAGSNLFLALWAAPYALTLFLFSSVSLYALGLVLLRFDPDLDYRFGLGPLTAAAAALTVVAVIYAVTRRHSGAVGEEGEPPPARGE